MKHNTKIEAQMFKVAPQPPCVNAFVICRLLPVNLTMKRETFFEIIF